jgi:hypothetical protein
MRHSAAACCQAARAPRNQHGSARRRGRISAPSAVRRWGAIVVVAGGRRRNEERSVRMRRQHDAAAACLCAPPQRTVRCAVWLRAAARMRARRTLFLASFFAPRSSSNVTTLARDRYVRPSAAACRQTDTPPHSVNTAAAGRREEAGRCGVCGSSVSRGTETGRRRSVACTRAESRAACAGCTTTGAVNNRANAHDGNPGVRALPLHQLGGCGAVLTRARLHGTQRTQRERRTQATSAHPICAVSCRTSVQRSARRRHVATLRCLQQRHVLRRAHVPAHSFCVLCGVRPAVSVLQQQRRRVSADYRMGLHAQRMRGNTQYRRRPARARSTPCTPDPGAPLLRAAAT